MNRVGEWAAVGILTAFTVSIAFAQQPGQKAAGQLTPKANGQPGQAGQPRNYHWGVTQTPWFIDPTIRQDLKLTDAQINRLNKAYGENWNRFTTATTDLGKLKAQERYEKMNEYSGTFHTSFMKSTQDILSQEQLPRFRQLYWQSRSYDALQDPSIQEKLSLTEQQKEKLRGFSKEYHERMGAIYNQIDREAAAKQFSDLRRQSHQQIEAFLNEQQRRNWRELVGDQFSFRPSFSPQQPNR